MVRVSKEKMELLKVVDPAAYTKLYNAVLEIRSDIRDIISKTVSAEDKVIAQVSILDDLDSFAVAFSDASMSMKKKTGEHLTKEIPGLKYRKVRMSLSKEIYCVITEEKLTRKHQTGTTR